MGGQVKGACCKCLCRPGRQSRLHLFFIPTTHSPPPPFPQFLGWIHDYIIVPVAGRFGYTPNVPPSKIISVIQPQKGTQIGILTAEQRSSVKRNELLVAKSDSGYVTKDDMVAPAKDATLKKSE